MAVRMWYEHTFRNIREIIHWLEGIDEHRWPIQVALAMYVLTDVQRIMTPSSGRRGEQVQLGQDNQHIFKMLSYLQALVNAMWVRNRSNAIVAGRAALHELENVSLLSVEADLSRSMQPDRLSSFDTSIGRGARTSRA